MDYNQDFAELINKVKSDQMAEIKEKLLPVVENLEFQIKTIKEFLKIHDKTTKSEAIQWGTVLPDILKDGPKTSKEIAVQIINYNKGEVSEHEISRIQNNFRNFLTNPKSTAIIKRIGSEGREGRYALNDWKPYSLDLFLGKEQLQQKGDK